MWTAALFLQSMDERFEYCTFRQRDGERSADTAVVVVVVVVVVCALAFAAREEKQTGSQVPEACEGRDFMNGSLFVWPDGATAAPIPKAKAILVPFLEACCFRGK